jgi:hypothetical protein
MPRLDPTLSRWRFPFPIRFLRRLSAKWKLRDPDDADGEAPKAWDGDLSCT